ncbi:MAG: hypothetical protein IJ721_03640 [Bacteroidales bacterium]|nr:hypothetical protein [Bacteroidales bacterium]
MEVPEVFFLSHFHADFGENFKLMLKAGIFGGYRMNIRRTDPVSVETDLAQAFSDHDRRLTYGTQFGFGAGLMFDPFEIHLMAQGKWGWSSFYEPDYYNPFYYRYAYPLDLVLTLGIYYQLTPRRGHTRAQLRRMAREMVSNQQE